MLLQEQVIAHEIKKKKRNAGIKQYCSTFP